MAKPSKILAAARANPASVTFAELRRLAEAAGFSLARTSGDHFIYTKLGVADIINLQPKGKGAKPYQVRQVVELIDKHEIEIE